MKIYVDASCQVTQCYKRRNEKLFPGTVVGFVNETKTIKNSVFIPREGIKKIIDSDIQIKNRECKVHCSLIFFCIEPFLKQIKEMIICPDFPKAMLSRELFNLFPNLKNIIFGKDGSRRSPADNYVNHIHKHPKEANTIVNPKQILEKIGKGLHKGKIS